MKRVLLAVFIVWSAFNYFSYYSRLASDGLVAKPLHKVLTFFK